MFFYQIESEFARVTTIDMHMDTAPFDLEQSDVLIYCVGIINKTMAISDTNSLGAIVVENMVDENRLATLIAEYTYHDITLGVIDTHIINCILSNSCIHRIDITTTIPNHIVDLLVESDIIGIRFTQRHNEYFIASLGKFKHLQSLSVRELFVSTDTAAFVDTIATTNLISLYLNIMFTAGIETHLDKLFTAMSLRILDLTIISEQIDGDMPATFDNWVESIAANKTITNFSINYDMPELFDTRLANAIKNNSTILEIEIANDHTMFSNEIIMAISESTSIKSFRTYSKFDDIDSFIYLLQYSKLTHINMGIFRSLLQSNIDRIKLALENNFDIIYLGRYLEKYLTDFNIYFERNKRLRYEEVHKHLVEFALIFLTTSFDLDPYVIKMLFDEWYEPASKDFHCAKKINVIYSIRQSIECLNK